MTEHRELMLRKAARGYIINTSPRGPEIGTEYAFNKIEEVAEWLVQTYNPRFVPTVTTFMDKPISDLTKEERKEFDDYRGREFKL